MKVSAQAQNVSSENTFSGHGHPESLGPPLSRDRRRPREPRNFMSPFKGSRFTPPREVRTQPPGKILRPGCGPLRPKGRAALAAGRPPPRATRGSGRATWSSPQAGRGSPPVDMVSRG